MSGLIPKYTPGDRTTLGAVDDERAAVGHHREVAHEDRLLLDLAGGGVHEAGGDEERARVGHVALAALLLGVLGRVEDVVGELELELAGEVLDRRDVAQDLGDTLVQEPLERFPLDGDEIGKLEDLPKLGEGQTFPRRETSQRHSSEGRRAPTSARLVSKCTNGQTRLRKQ